MRKWYLFILHSISKTFIGNNPTLLSEDKDRMSIKSNSYLQPKTV